LRGNIWTHDPPATLDVFLLFPGFPFLNMEGRIYIFQVTWGIKNADPIKPPGS
jgi:hypothetical protein